MKKFFLEEIARAMKGKIIVGNEKKIIKRIIKQPDLALAGCLYFVTDYFKDEDKLLNKLSSEGVSSIVVETLHNLNINKWIKMDIGIIQVNDRQDAYVKLAKYYRDKFKIPFIEVIGSSGKTTTKEMIGNVIREKMPALVGFYNYNAPAGVAFNIFQLRDYHKAAVLEVGMKGYGIMGYSSSMIQPNIAVVTSIHRSHLARLGSMENIIAAKAEMLEHLSDDGVLIINGEDEFCSKFPIYKHKGQILKFGFSNKFDIWASDIKYNGFKTEFKVNGKGFKICCSINTFGRYNIGNAMAAVAVGIKLGLNEEEISKGLLNFQPEHRRQKIHEGINSTILIDDNFNANPDSTKLLIQEMAHFDKKYPLILVIGDMENPNEKLEGYARKVHFMIGEEIGNLNFCKLIAIGKWAEEYVNGAISKGISQSKLVYFRTVKEAEKHIQDYIIPKSLVLFKASEHYVDLGPLLEKLKINNSSL